MAGSIFNALDAPLFLPVHWHVPVTSRSLDVVSQQGDYPANSTCNVILRSACSPCQGDAS
jgi:hypothetical protein